MPQHVGTTVLHRVVAAVEVTPPRLGFQTWLGSVSPCHSPQLSSASSWPSAPPDGPDLCREQGELLALPRLAFEGYLVLKDTGGGEKEISVPTSGQSVSHLGTEKSAMPAMGPHMLAQAWILGS